MRRLLLSVCVCLVGCNQPATREMSQGALELPAVGDSILMSAAAALENGQPWRAAQILEPVLRDSTQRTPERVLLAARAAAAWGGWSEVERHLGNEPWLDSRFDGLGRELLARAATARRQDTLVLRHARLAFDAATNPRDQGVRRVLIARALDRMDSLDRAAAAYVEAATLLPDVADWLHLRAAGVTEDSSARASHYAAVRIAVAKARIPWAEAQARERSRDFIGAARAYAALGSRVTPLRLRLTAARQIADTAAKDSVRRDLFDIVINRRGTSEARLAAELIDSSLTPITAPEELAIARSAAVAGPAARAIDGFARAFREGLGDLNDRYTYATLLTNADRYSEAAAQFARVKPPSRLAGRAAYGRARALLRSGAGRRAKTELERVATRFATDTTAAASSLYLLGDLAADDGRDNAARSFFRRVAARYPTSSFAVSARFRAAILAYVQGNARTAARELDTLALHRSASSETMAALYWSGRAWTRAGDSATARARWEAAMAREPGSYYAMLAARRLGREAWAPTSAADTIRPDTVVIAALRRADLLHDLGMENEEDLEYDWIAEQAGRSVDTALAAAYAFRAHNLAPRAIRLATKALSSGAESDDRVYGALYPLAYERVLVQEAERHRLDWSLVAALIRQESSYEPRATSRAGARGLMQIMPSVGRRLAMAEAYHTWDPALLYQPDVSLELGMTHLAGLLRGYDHVAHALAAYNAGSSRVRRWLEKAGTNDPEIFIERIPFRETRDYVRIILRNRELYRRMYRVRGGSSQSGVTTR